MPAPGYTWTPGYWAWNNSDYYWVPGVWVEPPRVGVLWTPPYWGFVAGVYMFHPGYWAPHVGFYGGINYGFGYGGAGYAGGRWDNGQFVYNRAVNNFGAVHVGNTYDAPVTINRTKLTNVSYNGGPGGLQVKPTPEQEQVAAEPHVRATPAQIDHVRTASVNPEQFQSANQGKPAIAATPRAGDLEGPGAVPAKAAGAAQVTPENVAPKAEEKLAPGAKIPTPGQPLNAEQKTLPGMKPAGAAQSSNGAQPPKTEPLDAPNLQQKLPPGAAPRGMKPPGAGKPALPATGAAPKGPETLPAGAMSGGPPKPPLEKPIAPVGQAKPQFAPKGPPAGAERKPPRPGDKPRLECGKPNLPACPK